MAETVYDLPWRQYMSGLAATVLCAGALSVSTSPSAQAAPNLSIDQQEIVDARVALRSAVPETCGDPGPNRDVAIQERTMRCLINYARAQVMGESVVLRTSAEWKATDIIRCDDWEHDTCGERWDSNIPREEFKKWGENLSYGDGAHGTAVEMFLAWMNSSTHRANILDPDWDEFSVVMKSGKVSFDASSGSAHIWVAHFGEHRE